MLSKRNLLILAILSCLSIAAFSQQAPLVVNDFLIVEITKGDIQQEFGLFAPFVTGEIRYQSRALITSIIDKFQYRSNCIIVDYWFPDVGDKRTFRQLLKSLDSKNVVTVVGGFFNDELESTNIQLFYGDSQIAHSFAKINQDPPGLYVIPPFKYGEAFNSEKLPSSVSNYLLTNPILHVSDLALLILGYDNIDIYRTTIPSYSLKSFSRITYREAIQSDISAPLVLVIVTQYEGSEDQTIIPGYGAITGPEIICNIMLHFSGDIE